MTGKFVPYGISHASITMVGDDKMFPRMDDATKFAPYGNSAGSASVAMVGKAKTPESLAELMPSTDIAAKVGILTVEQADTRTVRRKSGEA